MQKSQLNDFDVGSIDSLSIGTDIEEVARFRKLPFDQNANFYRKIFTEREINYCLQKADPYPHFAARFCGKEAVVKALSDAFKRTCPLKYVNIEIGVSRTGFPLVAIKGSGIAVGTRKSFKISLSHTSDYATATVLYLKREK
jgi:holo-[acyl-carrier protein] synthase